MIGFNRVKLRHAVTFVKYFACVVPLMFLPKTLTWNIINYCHQIYLGKQMGNNYAPCFNRVDFVVIPFYIELP